MRTRKYLYWGGGAVVIVALAVCGVIMLNGHDTPADTQANSTTADSEVQPIKSNDVKTPTNNDELANTLDDDASSMDNDLKNYENSDYNDSTLTDSSLMN